MRRSRGTIDPRMPLLRMLREFFAIRVPDLYRWPDVKIADPELHGEILAKPGALRPDKPDGKFVERVRATFGAYELRVESSAVSPPLGKIVLTANVPGGKPYVDGTLDQSTWQQAESVLRQHHEEPQHVHRQ